MSKRKPAAGERMIASAKQARAFASGNDNGCIIHHAALKDLLENRDLRARFYADAAGLSVDGFAEAHAGTVQRHYIDAGYEAPTYEEAYQQAADLWGHLRRDR